MNRTHRSSRPWPVGLVALAAALALTLLGLPASAAPADDADDVQQAVAAVTLVHPEDVRGNLTLPTTGLGDTTLSWASSDTNRVTATGEVTRPAHGAEPVDVTLTVTATKNAATARRDIGVRLQPLPAPADYDAYAFAYFTGESTDAGEKIYLGASKGDDPLDYDALNNGQPVLASQFGTRGLRDPFIIRSHEGDRFYLLATDLKAYPAVDFGAAQETGSKYLEIWESTDLVHWSDQRHVKVSSDLAGNTWAPEAFYDEAAGEYVVYWASALYPTADTSTRDIGTSYQRMMSATTRDFVTFSDPQPWIDVKRGTGLGMIDATVVKDGSTYYRFVKDEQYMTPRQERSTDLRATVTGSLPTTTSSPGWQLVREKVGVGQPNPWGGTFTAGEGPTAFRDNEDPSHWYLFIDQPSYHGGRGYVAFETHDIGSGQWTSMPDAQLPSSPRHGTVLPITQAELDIMRAAYQPDLLVTAVDEVSVRTRQGVAPQLPATVPATFGDGSSGEVAVTWEEVDPAQYAGPGTFTVTGTVTQGSADRPVATVTVTDAADPTVTLTDSPDGEAGWWVSAPASVAVSASDDTGVASVDTRLDNGPWVTTAGGGTTLQVDGDGVHTVEARALDRTGNTSSTEQRLVRVDTAPPVSRATASSSRLVTVRAADETSGVAAVQTRVGDGGWTAYAGPVQLPDAGGTVDYRAVDVAGNVEETHRLVVPSAGAELLPSTVLAVPGAARVPYGRPVALTVRVTGPGAVPTGTVRVLSGAAEVGAGRLGPDGRLRLSVASSALGVGTHHLTVRYDGSATYAPGEDAVTVSVRRARSTTTVVVRRPDTRGRGGLARVRVTRTPAHQSPAQVRVVLSRGDHVRAATWLALSPQGTARWRLPRLAAGTWTLTVTTPGTKGLVGSTDTARFRVARRHDRLARSGRPASAVPRG